MCTKLISKQQQLFKTINHTCHNQQIIFYSLSVQWKFPTNFKQKDETVTLQYHPNRSITYNKNHHKASVEYKHKRFYYTAKEMRNRELPQQITNEKIFTNTDKGGHDEEMDVETNFELRNVLYAETDDIMNALNTCSNLQKFKDTVQQLHNDFKKEHIMQAIVLTWMYHREKQYFEDGVYLKNDSNTKFLDYLLLKLQPYANDLNIHEMSCSLLYLRKMGVPVTHSIVKNLLINALNVINNSSEVIALPALSRLIVAINTGNDFFTPLVCAQFAKHIDAHIQNFQTDEDAHLLAICMKHLQPLIDHGSMLYTYKKRLNELMETGIILSQNPRTIIKIINMLNMGVWSEQNAVLIRKLMLYLQPFINELEENEIKNICRIYSHHKEPAALYEPLHRAIQKIYDTCKTPETLACFIPFSEPVQRNSLIKTFKELILNPECWQQQNSSLNIFSALRNLKITDRKICDAYWDGILNKIDNWPEEEFDHLKFLQHCHRYMNFNNNLGGTYRHMAFEKRLCREAIRIIEYELEGRLPYIFARLAAFIFAYGHMPYSWKKYPNNLISKIITMAEQFRPSDCLLLSRGLEISLKMRYRFEVPPLVGMQLATIDTVLSGCAEKYLTTNENQCSIKDLNILLKTLSYRKPLNNSLIYHKVLSRYNDVNCNGLNSRSIRNITYNMMSTNHLSPDIFHKMFQYIEKNHEHVTAETLEKLLTCAYNLGYVPKDGSALHYSGLILKRDFNRVSSLALVQACLALCFYKALPEDLIDKIFCAKFIHRIENEIQECYSKATYPERVLNLVMQLNRSVCLDYPQCNIPWFQQTFIEAQMSKNSSTYENNFQHDVKRFLTKILQDESYFRCNHVTPYGYQIDFVIHFDKNKQLLTAPSIETTMLDRITKVAILLLKLDSFCANDLETLRGPQSLKIKHLEMLGYKVLHINEHDWYSKYMNKPNAKQNYLRCLLQITN